jgi:uncharacterized small protein (DUF1192 family)
MSNIALITSKVNEMGASLTTWNRIAVFLVAAAAIAVALYFAVSYVARNKAARLENAKDELIRLELGQQALRITKVEKDSEERIGSVRAEIEERIALLTAEAAKEKSEIAKAREEAETAQQERVRLEAELTPRTIEQRQSAKELSQFQGMSVIIDSLAESESWRTAGQLAWLLSDAKWNVLPGMKRSLDATMFPDGITVETNGETLAQGEDRSLAAAKALMEVFVNNKVHADWRPSIEHLPLNTLKIRVGLKPIDYSDHNQQNAAYGNVLYR